VRNLTRIKRICEGKDVLLIELKLVWKLLQELPDTIKKLDEHGRPLVRLDRVPNAVAEHVTKLEPVLFNQGFEASKGAVVGIQHELSDGTQL